MSQIALIIIYNHRYDKNIPLLEEMYRNRFDNIYHIIPFYDGDKENVIPVYENSHRFSGYIAQTWQTIKDKGFSHFLFVADDLLLNPSVNQDNLFEKLGISETDCFIPELVEFAKLKKYWSRTPDACYYTWNKIGAEVGAILPDAETAKRKLNKHGISKFSISAKQFLSAFFATRAYYYPLAQTVGAMKKFLKNPFGRYHLYYPMVGGYSDTFLITADVMPQFVQYCGTFAATNLFVEVAIPTALALAADSIKTHEQTLLQGIFYADELEAITDKFDCDLNKLTDGFPEGYFYLHPIKLSKWQKKQ